MLLVCNHLLTSLSLGAPLPLYITKRLVLTEDGVIGYYNLAGLQTPDMGMQFLLSFQFFLKCEGVERECRIPVILDQNADELDCL